MTEFTHPPSYAILVAAALGVAGIIGISYRYARGQATGGIRSFLGLLRWLIIAALVVCLLDPQHVDKTVDKPRARIAVLLDGSKSMATKDVNGGRLEAGRAWVQSRLVEKYGDKLDLLTLVFGSDVARVSSLAGASPTGAVSAIDHALDRVLSASAEEPLTGVLLVSDGIDTTAADPLIAARNFHRKGIPVHTLVTGTTNEMRDVVVENVSVRRSVANESPTRVTLSLRSPGFGGKSVTATVRRGDKVLASKEVRLNGGIQTVDVEFTPQQKGFQIFDAGLGTLQGEWLASNNRRQFGLEVTDPTLRVLYMEGTPQNNRSPQPEWKYLKDALESDKYIKVTTLYRQLGNNGQFLNTVDADPVTGERIYPVEHPTRGFPRTLEGLLEYDVVIHSDIRISSFTETQLQNMAELVEKHGGGFVMIGGNSAFGKGGYHQTVLDRLIPVAMSSGNDSEARQVKLQLTRQGAAHPIMNFAGDLETTRRVWWEKFPMLYGMNQVERAKPGAIVLAQEGDVSGAAFQDANILIAVQEVGRGRSMAFTSDTTRAWGRDFETLWGERIRPGGVLSEDNCDARYYRQFWVNAIRWLAAGKAGRTNQPVLLELAQGYCVPGDPVKAQVRVRDEADRDVTTADVLLYLVQGGRSNVVGRASYDGAARRYIGDVIAPASGTYVVAAVASKGSVAVGGDRQLLVAETVDRELADLRARPGTMASIARTSGGSAFSLLDAAGSKMDALFQNIPPPTVSYKRTPLWDKPWWLGLVLATLCAEWAIRRWKGLA